jgi:hypothetical protein
MGFAQLCGINYQAVSIDDNGSPIIGLDVGGQTIDSKIINIRFSNTWLQVLKASFFINKLKLPQHINMT